MITIKIKETNEIKTLEMLDPESGTDNVLDFIGNSGGLITDGQFTRVDGEGYAFIVASSDYEWWKNVIAAHSKLNERILMLSRQYSTDEVIDALSEAYDCDLEDQPAIAHRNLDAVFGETNE